MRLTRSKCRGEFSGVETEKNGKEQALFDQFGGETSKGPIADSAAHNNCRCPELDQADQCGSGPWALVQRGQSLDCIYLR